MRISKIKFRYIFVPYYLILLGTLTAYSLFRYWWGHLELIEIDQVWINKWFPLLIGTIPVLIWLRKPTQIFKSESIKSNYQGLVLMAAVALIGICNLSLQSYLDGQLQRMVFVEEISETAELRGTRFFDIGDFEIKTSEVKALQHIRRTYSKYNRNSRYCQVYLAAPFAGTDHAYWYGRKYEKALPNRTSKPGIQSLCETFLQSSLRHFSRHPYRQARYFERLSASRDRDLFLQAVANEQATFNERNFEIFVPEFRSFADTSRTSFGGLLLWLGPGAFSFFLLLLILRADRYSVDEFRRRHAV